MNTQKKTRAKRKGCMRTHKTSVRFQTARVRCFCSPKSPPCFSPHLSQLYTRDTAKTHLHGARKAQADCADDCTLPRAVGPNHQIQPRPRVHHTLLIRQDVVHPVLRTDVRRSVNSRAVGLLAHPHTQRHAPLFAHTQQYAGSRGGSTPNALNVGSTGQHLRFCRAL